MKNKYRIIFVLGSISQPRCIKRIKSFLSHGFDIEIFGFDRGKYNQNAVIDGKKINIVGNKEDGKKYFKKFVQTNQIISRIVKEHNKSNTIFYSFGFVETLLLKIHGVRNYIYEISDILYGYKRFKYLRWFLKAIDKCLIKKSLLTVLTSEGFSNYLFKGKTFNNIIIQHNRVDSSFKTIPRIPKETSTVNDKLVFSFVGAFRSPETILRFARIIGENYPNYQFSFYGDSKLTEEVIQISEKFENVNYYGAFKSPDDLSAIYEKTDVIISCYDTKDLNERILEPNKLYEALFFMKPIIVSSNTFLSERVKKFGCGYSIDATNDNNIISFLNSINQKDLKTKSLNIQKVDLDEIIDDNAEKIVSFISQISKQN
jgi:glycosyltransferase involved in cell wall biosynthesis